MLLSCNTGLFTLMTGTTLPSPHPLPSIWVVFVFIGTFIILFHSILIQRNSKACAEITKIGKRNESIDSTHYPLHLNNSRAKLETFVLILIHRMVSSYRRKLDSISIMKKRPNYQHRKDCISSTKLVLILYVNSFNNISRYSIQTIVSHYWMHTMKMQCSR